MECNEALAAGWLQPHVCYALSCIVICQDVLQMAFWSCSHFVGAGPVQNCMYMNV